MDDRRNAPHTAEESVSFAVGEGLPVMFVTEDTTRADGETLKALYGNAIRWGVRRICLSDTVGHATPSGVRALLRFVKREIVDPSGANVKIDWHGHRDRGLGLANALVAIEAGADRVHGTAMGIGERVGNVQMDLLLVNLALAGVHDADLTRLADYCELVARECGVPLPPNYPVLGDDAFRTATGVHAAAIAKAKAKGANWLADRIYSGVPAAMVGRRQEIEIGPMSGISNVKYWLARRGYDADDEALCRRIFARAKNADQTLTEEEVLSIVRGGRGRSRPLDARRPGPRRPPAFAMRIPLRSAVWTLGAGAVVLAAVAAWAVARRAAAEAMYGQGERRLGAATTLGAERLRASRGQPLDSVAAALALATGYRVSVFDGEMALLADSDLGPATPPPPPDPDPCAPRSRARCCAPPPRRGAPACSTAAATSSARPVSIAGANRW